jgi:VIT1/CCC1 family predicted Fe2+/Mn2+ transporter
MPQPTRSGAKGSIRRWLRERRLVRTALATPVDPTLYRRPPARIMVGLAFLAASYIFGWPAVIALGAAAAWLEQPKLLVASPVVYGLSWVLFAIGLALIGKKSISAGRAFGLLLVRKLAERFLLD